MNGPNMLDFYDQYRKCVKRSCRAQLKALDAMLAIHSRDMPIFPSKVTSAKIKAFKQAMDKFNTETHNMKEMIELHQCKFSKCNDGAMKDSKIVIDNLHIQCKKGKKINCVKAENAEKLLQPKITFESYRKLQNMAKMMPTF